MSTVGDQWATRGHAALRTAWATNHATVQHTDIPEVAAAKPAARNPGNQARTCLCGPWGDKVKKVHAKLNTAFWLEFNTKAKSTPGKDPLQSGRAVLLFVGWRPAATRGSEDHVAETTMCAHIADMLFCPPKKCSTTACACGARWL